MPNDQSMDFVKNTFAMLGRKAKDKISGTEGIITSIVFDLYGCVQCSVHSGLDKEGKQRETFWYDVSRVELSDEPAVMQPPTYAAVPRAAPENYTLGSAEKPAPSR